MKKGGLSLFFLICTYLSFANHIVGGEMSYHYVGPGNTPGTSRYTITLLLFRDQHTTGAQMPTDVTIGVYNNDDGKEYPIPGTPNTVIKDDEGSVHIDPFPPCLTGSPDLDYHVGYFTFTVDLPKNNKGYTATYQTCCRVNPLANVYNATGGSGTGATYSCTIPPVHDNSPTFTTTLDLICANRQFKLNFIRWFIHFAMRMMAVQLKTPLI